MGQDKITNSDRRAVGWACMPSRLGCGLPTMDKEEEGNHRRDSPGRQQQPKEATYGHNGSKHPTSPFMIASELRCNSFSSSSGPTSS